MSRGLAAYLVVPIFHLELSGPGPIYASGVRALVPAPPGGASVTAKTPLAAGHAHDPPSCPVRRALAQATGFASMSSCSA